MEDSTKLRLEDKMIKNNIFNIRGLQVMMDRDLATLYGIETKTLNQAVKRNKDRFPNEFRLQLSNEEKAELVTNCDRFKNMKHSTINPYAFTEHGVLMLANVIKSQIAIEVSIRLVNIFVEMRSMLNSENLMKLDIALIKEHLSKQGQRISNHDKNMEIVFQYLDELMVKKQSAEKNKI